jgi:hypothetical protein
MRPPRAGAAWQQPKQTNLVLGVSCSSPDRAGDQCGGGWSHHPKRAVRFGKCHIAIIRYLWVDRVVTIPWLGTTDLVIAVISPKLVSSFIISKSS